MTDTIAGMPVTAEQWHTYSTQLHAVQIALQHVACNPLCDISPREMARMASYVDSEARWVISKVT